MKDRQPGPEMSSDGVFTVEARPQVSGDDRSKVISAAILAVHPARKRGRPRSTDAARLEREFVKLLNRGFSVAVAQEMSGLSDRRALRIVAEFWDAWRAA